MSTATLPDGRRVPISAYRALIFEKIIRDNPKKRISIMQCLKGRKTTQIPVKEMKRWV